MEDHFENAKYIIRDAEGYYRWTYDVESSKNRSLLNLYLLIFGLVILVPGVIFLLMYGGKIAGSDGLRNFLLILLAIFAGAELLTVLIYKGIEKLKGGTISTPYLMGEEFIVVHPGTKMAPDAYVRTEFSHVKDVRVDLKSDLILLNEPLRVTHVYVPHEDLSLALRFILDRVPTSPKIEKLKEEFTRRDGSR